MNSIIDVQNLTKQYGSTTAIDGISFSLEQNGVIGLVGKNGAGKTTLLSIIAGASRPSLGSVKIIEKENRHNVSFLPQDGIFKNGITARKQLIHFSRLQGLSNTDAEKEVSELIEQFCEKNTADKKPENLSYGQRKRLGLVQAFLGKPQLILLDEPTAGLDPVAANDVREFIVSLARDTTLIVSSHNLYEIQDICSQILVLDSGLLIDKINMADLKEKDNFLQILLNHPPSEVLISELSMLAEVTELNINKKVPESIELHTATSDLNSIQMKIFSIIQQHNFDVVEFTRNRTLTDQVRNLINDHNTNN